MGCEEQKRPMNYDDNFIAVKLRVGPYFGKKPNAYEIHIDFNKLPPKYEQVHTQKLSTRKVKRIRTDSILQINVPMKKLRNLQKNVPKVFGLKDILNENVVYILSNLIEYEPNAKHSHAIMKRHYDLKIAANKDRQSYFDEIMPLAQKLKLRHGYDRILLAIEPFYKKIKVEIVSQTPSKRIFVDMAKINSQIFGIKQVDLNVDIAVVSNVKIKKKKDYDIEAEKDDQIFCEIWLKIPINPSEHQIESWNDILMYEFSVDLTKNDFSKNVKLNLSDYCDALGAWNPSLFYDNYEDLKHLEFETKINQKNDADVVDGDYDFYPTLKSAEIVLITNEKEEKDKIDEFDKEFWKKYVPVHWYYTVDGDFKMYDRAANAQIKRDYQKALGAVDQDTTIIIPITDGPWAHKKEVMGKYQIRIIRSAIQCVFYQINIETGTNRVVKREMGWIGNKNTENVDIDDEKKENDEEVP